MISMISRDKYDCIPILKLPKTMIEQLKKTLQVTPEELKQTTILKQKGDVFYLLLNTKANTFTASFVRDIHAQLDKVQANEGSTSLVTVSLSKPFSGGLDLKYMSNIDYTEDQKYFVTSFIALLGRIAVLPFPTFAIVKGGAVAGGCMFAFVHDYVYVAGKAMFSCNEAQNQIHFPPGMIASIRKRHAHPSALRDMVLFSKQFSAEEALQNKFIDGILKEEEALQWVQGKADEVSFLGDNKENFGNIKRELYYELVEDTLHKQLFGHLSGYRKLKQFPKL